jgi:glycosyltransferase involved in cell wall biosynthesis
MKIAVVTTDNREHDRNYQAARPYFGTAPEALLQGLAGLEGVRVHVLGCTQQPMASPEKLAENIWFHSLHVPKWGWMRTGYQGCIRAVRRQLAVIQPDIVHGQGTERECAISAVLGGFPSVLTIHGNMNAIARLHHSRMGSFHWLAARLEDFTLPRTKGILCISDYVGDWVNTAGVPTWIVPNAIQRMFFDFHRAGTPRRERPLFINVGVISERKRQAQLLAVLETLRGQNLEFDTIFVGVSDPKSAYAREFETRLAEASRRHGGFAHIRKLDDASFCQLMDQASAMIHFSNEESFGLTFAEAIARGLYLFASDVGAARFIAQGVERVQIFGLEDWAGMQAAVRQWLLDGAWRQPPPASPPAEFARHFHPVSVARRHLEIYRSVLGGGSGKS